MFGFTIHNRVDLGPDTWHQVYYIGYLVHTYLACNYYMHTEYCCRRGCCCCSVRCHVYCYCCHTCCCCCCCCCCCLLLLFVIVCRMTKFAAGSLNLIPVFSFSSFKHDVFLMYRLAVLWRRIHGLELPTSSVITGMRGANAGIISPRRSTPCKLPGMY